jgi:Protein of unknown function (DUF1697)
MLNTSCSQNDPIRTWPLLDHAAVCYGLSMTKYIVLLRAVNVGGTAKLPMSELKAMCCDAGFARVETWQSTHSR